MQKNDDAQKLKQNFWEKIKNSIGQFFYHKYCTSFMILVN